MLRRNIFFPVLFGFISLLACEKTESGPVELNVVLFQKAGSPYSLFETLEVPADKTLRIEAGVELLLDTGVFINAYGPVEILGTAEEPVMLNAMVPGLGWKQLKAKPGSDYIRMYHTVFNDGTMTSSADTVHFNHVTFNNNQHLAWDGAMARFWNARSFLIENNTINGSNRGEGILCHDVLNPVVKDSKFNQIPDGVEYIGSDQGRIENNVFEGGNDDAIDLNNCRTIIITGNQIFNYADCGMEIGSENFGSSEDIMVYRNIMVGCRKGLIIKEASSAIILNNTFYKNQIGAEFSGLSNGQTSFADVFNCIFLEQDQVFKIDGFSTAIFRYNLSPEEALPGTNNLHEEPLLSDPSLRHFELLTGSPCIDAGDPDSPPDPDGTRADIGAVYFQH